MRSFLWSICTLVAVAFAASADDRPYGPTKVTVAVNDHATVRFLSPVKLDDAGRWDDSFDSESIASDAGSFTIRFDGKVKGTSALILTSGGKLAKVTVEVVDAPPTPVAPPGPAPVPIPILPTAPPMIPPAVGQPKKISYPAAQPVAKGVKSPAPFARRPSPALVVTTDSKSSSAKVSQEFRTSPDTHVLDAANPVSSRTASFPKSQPVPTYTLANVTGSRGGIIPAVDSGCATASG